MKLSYLKIAAVYLILSFLITPLSCLLKVSLAPLSDIFISFMAVTTLLHKNSTVNLNKFNRNLLWVLVLILIAIIQELTLLRYGIGVEVFDIIRKSRGLLIFLITIYVYIYIYSQSSSNGFTKIDRLIEIIIKINIAVILLEGLAINLFVDQNLLAAIFEPSYEIQPNPFFTHFVPNGLVFGYQHSGFLALAGIFRWFPWIKGSRIQNNHLLWLILSCIALVMTITGTSVIALVSVLFFSSFIKGLRTHSAILRIAVAVSMVITIIQVKDILAFKLARYADIDLIFSAYLEKFTDPINVIIKNPIEGMLGSGHVSDSSVITSDIYRAVMSSDFGFGDLTIRFGVILILSICIVYVVYLLRIIKFFKWQNVPKNEKQIVITTALINLSFIISTLHYSTLFKYGVMQFSASLIALSYVLTRRQWVRQLQIRHGNSLAVDQEEEVPDNIIFN